MFSVCLTCSSPSASLLCPRCQCEARALVHTRHELERCIPGTEIPLFSFASYQGKIKRLVQLAKSPRLERSTLVEPWLFVAARRLCASLQETFFGFPPWMVVPLPERRFGLDGRRALARDLAQLLASQLGIPCHLSLLKHRHWIDRYFGRPQKEKRRRDRLAHPPRYSVSPDTQNQKIPHDIILVDDVCTTGHSLRAAIAPLHDAGFRVRAAALLADTPAYL